MANEKYGDLMFTLLIADLEHQRKITSEQKKSNLYKENSTPGFWTHNEGYKNRTSSVNQKDNLKVESHKPSGNYALGYKSNSSSSGEG